MLYTISPCFQSSQQRHFTDEEKQLVHDIIEKNSTLNNSHNSSNSPRASPSGAPTNFLITRTATSTASQQSIVPLAVTTLGNNNNENINNNHHKANGLLVGGAGEANFAFSSNPNRVVIVNTPTPSELQLEINKSLQLHVQQAQQGLQPVTTLPSVNLANLGNLTGFGNSGSPAVPSTSVASLSSTPGRYICPYCQLNCAKPSVLQKHIRAHTNERPFPCNQCGFAFKTKSNLYKHCR